MATSQSTADREVYGLSVEIRVLGPIEVVADGQPLRLGGPTQRAVLAVLISEIGQVVSVDYLVDAVWGEAPPTAVRNSIYSYISNLRSLLGTPIERTGSGYRLGGDPSLVDANLFQRSIDEGRQALATNPSQAAETLRAGLSLWRGRPCMRTHRCWWASG